MSQKFGEHESYHASYLLNSGLIFTQLAGNTFHIHVEFTRTILALKAVLKSVHLCPSPYPLQRQKTNSDITGVRWDIRKNLSVVLESFGQPQFNLTCQGSSFSFRCHACPRGDTTIKYSIHWN